MRETSQSLEAPFGRAPVAPPASGASSSKALVADWHYGLSILNIRGNPDDAAFREGVAQALGLALPTKACTTAASDELRLVWVGPDDWFVIGPLGQAATMEWRLRNALTAHGQEQHFAVTDVSSGYTLLRLGGQPVREVLAQGCPLDLHPRVFRPGSSAGSLFFKASIWLWQTEEAPVYELLVRNSFRGYVRLMLDRATHACGLVGPA